MPEDLDLMARDNEDLRFTDLDFIIFMNKSVGQPKYYARIVKPRSRVGERQYHYFYSKEEYDAYLKRKSGLKVESPPAFKSIWIKIAGKLFKTQLGMFGEGEKEVQKPGSRGGKFYYSKEGKIVYGTRPVKKQKKGEPKEQYELISPQSTISSPLTQKERELEFIKKMVKQGRLPKGVEKLVFKKPTPSKKRVVREEKKWETGLFAPSKKQGGLFNRVEAEKETPIESVTYDGRQYEKINGIWYNKQTDTKVINVGWVIELDKKAKESKINGKTAKKPWEMTQKEYIQNAMTERKIADLEEANRIEQGLKDIAWRYLLSMESFNDAV